MLEAFKQIDLDGSGSIEYAEIEKGIRAMVLPRPLPNARPAAGPPACRPAARVPCHLADPARHLRPRRTPTSPRRNARK